MQSDPASPSLLFPPLFSLPLLFLLLLSDGAGSLLFYGSSPSPPFLSFSLYAGEDEEGVRGRDWW